MNLDFLGTDVGWDRGFEFGAQPLALRERWQNGNDSGEVVKLKSDHSPSSKFQVPDCCLTAKTVTPDTRCESGVMFWSLELGIWSFFGTWNLELGTFISQ